MGWRISFGIGPLRYSAPLGRRRRRYASRRYVAPPPQRFQVTPRQARADWVVARVAFTIVVVAVLVIGIAVALS